LIAQLDWIAIVKSFRLIKFGVTLSRSITANPMDATCPISIFKYARKVIRMSAMHHKINGTAIGRFVDGFDSFL